MMTMVVASIILVALAVIVHILVWNELPDSISDMVYKLPSGGWQWAWTIWLWVVLILLAPQLITVLDDSYKVFGFLTVSCLALVAAMPHFEVTDRKWHYVLAIVGGILSQVCVALIFPWWLLLWFVMVFLVGKSFAAFNDSENIPEVLSGKGVFVAEVSLAQVQLYANQCYNVTEQHLAEIDALTSRGDILEYDITKGYPEKMRFEVPVEE